MKKLLVILTVLLTTVLSGCELIGLSKIAIASNNMDKLDSYQMDMDVEVTNLGTLSGVAYVDGNYTEMTMEGFTMEMFEIDGNIYTIEIDEFLKLPILVRDEEQEEEDYDDFSIYEDFDFEQDGDYYVLTDGASDLFEDVETLRIKIEDDYITEMIMEGTMESYEMVFTITFSEFDEIELDPPFYVTEEEITDLHERAEQLGFNSVFPMGESFSLVGTLVVDCFSQSNACFIESYVGLLEYNPRNKTLLTELHENALPYETAISELQYDMVTVELIEFIDEYYFLYKEYIGQ